MAAISPTHVFPGFPTPVMHTTNFPSNWLLFHIRLNDACLIDFYQISEGMLAKLGFDLTTPGLTACVATEARHPIFETSLYQVTINAFCSRKHEKRRKKALNAFLNLKTVKLAHTHDTGYMVVKAIFS